MLAVVFMAESGRTYSEFFAPVPTKLSCIFFSCSFSLQIPPKRNESISVQLHENREVAWFLFIINILG